MFSDELRFSVAGHEVAVLQLGDPNGIPVVALHGWLDNAATYRLLAEHLRGVRLLAVDLIGHGRSAHRPESTPYYIWDNVADVVELFDLLELSDVNLMGHSMGASIATLVAGCYPDRIKNLCLIEGIAPLVYEEDSLPELMAVAIDKRKRQRDKKKISRSYPNIESAVKAREDGRWPVPKQAAEWLVERGSIIKSEGVCWSNDPRLVLPSVLRMSETQVRSFIKRIKCDVTLVIGDEGLKDGLVPERLDYFLNINVVELPGSHHLHLQPLGAEAIAGIVSGWAG